MHYCYILYSAKTGKYYIGESADVNKRLLIHNDKILNTNSTKSGIPWEVRLIITCENRAHALRIEKYIKKMKSKVYIENLIKYPELVTKLIASC